MGVLRGGAWSGSRPIFSFDAHNHISRTAETRSSRQILYAGRIYLMLTLGWQTIPICRGQGHVTLFSFLPQSYLWSRWNYALQMSCADWYRGTSACKFWDIGPRYLGNGARQRHGWNEVTSKLTYSLINSLISSFSFDSALGSSTTPSLS